MDSAIVYRHMDIGTDKPDRTTRERIPHHLVDIRDPEEAYSAGAFARDAANAIRAINARGRIALIVGGTLLYLRALREGLADLPERNEAVRAAIEAEAGDRGWPALHGELEHIDPDAAARIEPTDRQRIQRALEVYRVTGQTLTALQRMATDDEALEVPGVALLPSDRARLRADIENRFDAMVAAGFVDEVRALRARPGLTASSASMRCVGYRQVWSHLEGELDWSSARERAIVATRQLAKRQLTWLRGDTASVRLEGDARARLSATRALIERQFP